MNEDLMIKKLIILEQDVTVIKETIKKLDGWDNLISGQDKMIRILERLDQERVFTNQKINELENDVQHIKKHLHLA